MSSEHEAALSELKKMLGEAADEFKSGKPVEQLIDPDRLKAAAKVFGDHNNPNAPPSAFDRLKATDILKTYAKWVFDEAARGLGPTDVMLLTVRLWSDMTKALAASQHIREEAIPDFDEFMSAMYSAVWKTTAAESLLAVYKKARAQA